MPSFRAAPVRVRVPASSANLGPAFDSAGLALALYDDVIVRVADSGLSVDVAGEGADDLPRDKRHLVVKALRAAFTQLGGQPRGLEIVCANRIPQSRGLGSSSAAIVAAIVAARALVLGGEEILDDTAALELATELEGHPDNVAACLHGGLTFAWTGAQGLRVHRLTPHPSLLPVAFIPSSRASTKKARSLLPDTIAVRRRCIELGPRSTALAGADRQPGAAARRHRGPAAPGLPRRGDAPHRGPGEGATRGRHPGGRQRRRPDRAGAHHDRDRRDRRGALTACVGRHDAARRRRRRQRAAARLTVLSAVPVILGEHAGDGACCHSVSAAVTLSSYQ